MRCPFEIGEEVVCIESVDYVSKWTRDTNKKEITVLLTCDKHYIITTLNGKLYDNIGVKGDHGFEFQPNWLKFVSLKEYRKRKLNKLNQK